MREEKERKGKEKKGKKSKVPPHDRSSQSVRKYAGYVRVLLVQFFKRQLMFLH